MGCNVDIKRFIQGISFSNLQPTDPGIALLCGSSSNCVCTSADLTITHFMDDEVRLKELLGPLCIIPRMSTFAIGAIINRLVSSLENDTSFVNIGVWNGFSFLSGITGNSDKKCVGVDNFSEFGGPREDFLQRFNSLRSQNHLFFDLDYEAYFKTVHTGSIGFYIYDGNHSAEHQNHGLTVAEPYFSDHCYLLIDDINDNGPMDGTEGFLRSSKFRYNIIYCQQTSHNMHPTYWNGILLLEKNGLK